jgi:hypothetical protein
MKGADIESKGREGLRARSADTTRSEMTKAEMDVLTKVAERFANWKVPRCRIILVVAVPVTGPLSWFTS